ncbi:DEAD/DEAH box helicase family protein [Vulcanisaeta moutnovskia]|nr:hypothetical protein [Vulcanisaeta moutnovskia]
MALRGDQAEVANKLLAMLGEKNVAGLQAPTGWGKSFVASFLIKQLGGRWLWASSLINALVEAGKALGDFGIRHFLSTGRERLCLKNYRHSDFVIRKPCGFCQFNRPIPQSLVKALINAVDYGVVREFAEEGGLCPYSTQETLVRELLNEYGDLVVVLMNYGRISKHAKRFDGLIIDEAHNLAVPKLVSLPRRGFELLFEKLGVEGVDVKDAELVRSLLGELLLTIAIDSGLSELVSLDDLVAFIESPITYYDPDSDALIGVKLEGLPSLENKRVLLMSATLPPSVLSTIPVIRVEPSQVIKARVGDAVMTTENIERLKNEVAKRLSDLLSDGLPTVIFTTSSKEVIIENVVYEDELRREDICKRSIVLRFFGKYAEGVRLNCYKRVVLLTLPLLPPNVMRRLEVRGLRSVDLITIKAVQAVGRLLPSNEAIEVILFDKRFRRYCGVLMNYGIQCVGNG